MENNSTFFHDTAQGLLEAIAYEKGLSSAEEIQGMPAKTLRVKACESEKKVNKGEKILVG